MFFHGAMHVKIKYLKQDNKMFTGESKKLKKGATLSLVSIIKAAKRLRKKGVLLVIVQAF